VVSVDRISKKGLRQSDAHLVIVVAPATAETWRKTVAHYDEIWGCEQTNVGGRMSKNEAAQREKRIKLGAKWGEKLETPQ
jgi:hypothetical protein